MSSVAAPTLVLIATKVWWHYSPQTDWSAVKIGPTVECDTGALWECVYCHSAARYAVQLICLRKSPKWHDYNLVCLFSF